MSPITDFEKLIHSTKLLPYVYKKIGYTFLLLTLLAPVFFFYTKGLVNWKEWWVTIIYYPAAIGLTLIVFSKEKVEDEMVSLVRFRSFVYGVYMFAVSMLFFPLLSNIRGLIGDQPIMPKELGGSMAALTILLLCIFISFRVQLFVAKNPSE